MLRMVYLANATASSSNDWESSVRDLLCLVFAVLRNPALTCLDHCDGVVRFD